MSDRSRAGRRGRQPVPRPTTGSAARSARRLAERPLPDGVQVVDYGIRGMHLAYDLLDGYDALVVVDAAARRRAPRVT